MSTLAEVIREAGRRHVETMTAETTARISDAEAEAALDWFAARLADPAVVESVRAALVQHQWSHTATTHCACGFRTPLAQLAIDGFLDHQTAAALAAITTALSTEAS